MVSPYGLRKRGDQEMTGTEVFEAIGSATTITKSIQQAISSVVGITSDTKAKKNLIDAQSSILSLQSHLLKFQEAIFALQKEVLTLEREKDELRRQIREEEVRSTERKEYERRQVGPSKSVVMVPKGETEPMFCFTCFEKGHLSALQPMTSSFRVFGSHKCPACSNTFHIN